MDSFDKKLARFEKFEDGRWQTAPLGHALSLLMTPPIPVDTSSSSGLSSSSSTTAPACSTTVAKAETGDLEGKALHSTLSFQGNFHGGDFAFDASTGAVSTCEESAPANPDGQQVPENREKFMYMDDEQIHASFPSKRQYEREWRHKKKRKEARSTRNRMAITTLRASDI